MTTITIQQEKARIWGLMQDKWAQMPDQDIATRLIADMRKLRQSQHGLAQMEKAQVFQQSPALPVTRIRLENNSSRIKAREDAIAYLQNQMAIDGVSAPADTTPIGMDEQPPQAADPSGGLNHEETMHQHARRVYDWVQAMD